MLAVILYKYSVCACLTSKCMSDYQNCKIVNLWTFLFIMQSMQMSTEITTVIYFYGGGGWEGGRGGGREFWAVCYKSLPY